MKKIHKIQTHVNTLSSSPRVAMSVMWIVRSPLFQQGELALAMVGQQGEDIQVKHSESFTFTLYEMISHKFKVLMKQTWRHTNQV